MNKETQLTSEEQLNSTDDSTSLKYRNLSHSLLSLNTGFASFYSIYGNYQRTCLTEVELKKIIKHYFENISDKLKTRKTRRKGVHECFYTITSQHFFLFVQKFPCTPLNLNKILNKQLLLCISFSINIRLRPVSFRKQE